MKFNRYMYQTMNSKIYMSAQNNKNNQKIVSLSFLMTGGSPPHPPQLELESIREREMRRMNNTDSEYAIIENTQKYITNLVLCSGCSPQNIAQKIINDMTQQNLNISEVIAMLVS